MKPRNWTLTKANLHLLHSTIVYGFPLLHGCNKAVTSYRGNVKSFFQEEWISSKKNSVPISVQYSSLDIALATEKFLHIICFDRL